ncbi:MAG: quinone oxidoreductase [Bryocella sp.]
MRAIQIAQTGGPEVLQLVEIDTPEPKSGEVLVRVAAAGVNFIDVYLREGRYPAPLPFVAGQEGAGTIVALGGDVTGFDIGDRVAWSMTRGAYAEFAAVPVSILVKVPEIISLEDAAAVLLQGVTAEYLATSTYVIQAGDTVLIHAGAGGVGLLLTQIAKIHGAQVITTVSTEMKAELSRKAGADHVILYTLQNFAEEVKRITAEEGLPVVYDSVGKTTFEDSLKCLRPRGLLVLFGASSGPVPPFDLMRLSQMGSLFVTRPTMNNYVPTREDLEKRTTDLFYWIGRGKLHVRIGQRFPLAEAAEAHRALEGRKTTGKVLLIP